MTDLPAVAVVLYTYDRLSVAQQTLTALVANLHYDGPLVLHIADDGSPDVPVSIDGEAEPSQFTSYLDDLRKFAEGLSLGTTEVQTSTSVRMGYGGSYNGASQRTHSYADVLLPLEDDWELSRPFDITPLVRALADPRINCIRLGYIGYTQALRGEIIDVAPSGKFLLFDPDSPERHVFAGHPRLETREFQRAVGPWPERIQAGQTEFDVSGRPESRQGVVWPLDLGIPGSQRHDSLFRHIGADGKGEIDPTAE